MLGQKLLLLGVIGVLSACGGGKRGAEAPDVVVTQSDAGLGAPSVPESVDTPLTSLQRREVVETVEEGLGRFLQEVELEETLSEGEFQGFRIVAFTHPERWTGVGLLVGDVVVSINDSPIERPEQAYAVFVNLKTAPALEVSYLRQGEKMRLSLPITGAAASPSAPAKSSPGAEK